MRSTLRWAIEAKRRCDSGTLACLTVAQNVDRALRAVSRRSQRVRQEQIFAPGEVGPQRSAKAWRSPSPPPPACFSSSHAPPSCGSRATARIGVRAHEEDGSSG